MGTEKNEKQKNKKQYSYKDRVLLEGFKNVLLSSVIYFIGYMHWSIAWIIIPVIIGVFDEERKKRNVQRRDFIREAALGNEQKVILENIEDLPAWVYFPDIERAEWVNKIIRQFWPNVNHYARDFILNKLEDILSRKMEKYALKGFTLQRVILGSVPFRSGGIIVYDNVSRDEIVMDVDISYAGDCDIKFRLKKLIGGIKNFQLYGKLRIVLRPLLKSMPLVGGLQAFFLNNPDIDFDLDGFAGIFETPGIIIHVIEAKDLMKKDIGFTGKGKSDPYAVLEVGGQSFRTDTIDCTVNPKWDYWCEFVILEFNGQLLNINVWDQDTTKDEFLGRVSLDLSNLIKAGPKDMWLNLEDIKHGKIHIRCIWLSLSANYSFLHEALYETQQLHLTDMNTALLIVYIDSASDLPQLKPTAKPDPYVQIQVGKQIKCTQLAQKTTSPVWEEGFIFFVNNPEADFLDLAILDGKTESSLCSLNFNIGSLSSKENLEILEQPFRLQNTTLDSTIVWSLHLKILRNERSEEYIEGFFSERRRSNSSDNSNCKIQMEMQHVDDEKPLPINNNTLDVFDQLPKSARSSAVSTSSIPKKLRKSKSSDEYTVMPRIKLTIRYSKQRQILIVVVHTAADLPFKDHKERKVYVKSYLLPEKKYTKKKTSVINTNHPVFDESFEYLVSQGELNSKTLEIAVIEEKPIKNSILGKANIDLGRLNILIGTHIGWFNLYPHLKKE